MSPPGKVAPGSNADITRNLVVPITHVIGTVNEKVVKVFAATESTCPSFSYPVSNTSFPFRSIQAAAPKSTHVPDLIARVYDSPVISVGAVIEEK